jgi:uncharacterized membrane protein YraQ (UPF0718 family)
LTRSEERGLHAAQALALRAGHVPFNPMPPLSNKKKNRILDTSFIALSVLALIGMAACCAKGRVFFLNGLDASLSTLRQVLPKLLGAFFLAGFAQVLAPKELINKWMGAKSGFKGILIATMAGAFTPGGPLTSFPIIAALYKLGVDYGPLVAYIAAWEILGLQRILIWEIPFMGMKFVLLRYAVSMVLPVIAGITARKMVVFLNQQPFIKPKEGE